MVLEPTILEAKIISLAVHILARILDYHYPLQFTFLEEAEI
jgi:hypothetical protein